MPRTIPRNSSKKGGAQVTQIDSFKSKSTLTVGGKTLLALIERDELIAQYAVRAR